MAVKPYWESKKPTYCLETCQRLIACQKYILSTNAYDFIDHLSAANDFDFSIEDFERFVSQLTPANFDKSLQYAQDRDKMDAYVAEYKFCYEDEYGDTKVEKFTLYFKYCLIKEGMMVKTISFHLS